MCQKSCCVLFMEHWRYSGRLSDRDVDLMAGFKGFVLPFDLRPSVRPQAAESLFVACPGQARKMNSCVSAKALFLINHEPSLRLSHPPALPGVPTASKVARTRSGLDTEIKSQPASSNALVGSDQSIGFAPVPANHRLAAEKCPHPMNPRCADSGDGWGALRTQWRCESISLPLACA